MNARSAAIKSWAKYKYTGGFAKCPISPQVRPESVPVSVVGHHTSVVFVRGMRHYSFMSIEGRDKFVQIYAQHGAEVCEDPYP